MHFLKKEIFWNEAKSSKEFEALGTLKGVEKEYGVDGFI